MYMTPKYYAVILFFARVTVAFVVMAVLVTAAEVALIVRFYGHARSQLTTDD